METYNKLVRDNILEIIRLENKIVKSRILSDEEYKLEALKKIVEEAHEVLEARNDKNDLMKEIGDLQEVIEAVIYAFNLNEKEILEIKNQRKQERGGFDKKIFLESVE